MKIQRSHELGIDEARNRADRIAADLKERFSLQSDWQDDALHVSGNGISGQLTIDESQVELDVKLGFALKLMEPTIRSAIEETFDEELGSA